MYMHIFTYLSESMHTHTHAQKTYIYIHIYIIIYRYMVTHLQFNLCFCSLTNPTWECSEATSRFFDIGLLRGTLVVQGQSLLGYF